MATYLKEKEIKSLLDRLIDKFISECRRTGDLDPDFVELIKHNFYAKYVYYDSGSEMIEIGINESEVRTPHYAQIKVYHYGLSEIYEWLGENFKNTSFDLEFYAKLIGKDQDSDPEIIVMDGDDK